MAVCGRFVCVCVQYQRTREAEGKRVMTETRSGYMSVRINIIYLYISIFSPQCTVATAQKEYRVFDWPKRWQRTTLNLLL